WFFFFQAEDGIRDRNVTGVQTCALPIFHRVASASCRGSDDVREAALDPAEVQAADDRQGQADGPRHGQTVRVERAAHGRGPEVRSEERRVGKERRGGRGRGQGRERWVKR